MSLSCPQQHFMESSVPCVLVASKQDLPEVKQFHGMTPAEFCYKHRLPPPLPFSYLLPNANIKNVYGRLAWAAAYPYVSQRRPAPGGGFLCVTCVCFISRHLNGSEISHTSFWLRVALGSAVVAVLGFALYRAVARLK